MHHRIQYRITCYSFMKNLTANTKIKSAGPLLFNTEGNTRFIYMYASSSKNFISGESYKSPCSYRFRFIGCEALCMHVEDSRDTDLRSANEDVHILTPSLNFSPSILTTRSLFFTIVCRCSARLPTPLALRMISLL